MNTIKYINDMCFKVIQLCVLAVWFITSGCTPYWTKGFYIQKGTNNYAKTSDADFSIFDSLDERFEDWRIFISIWSVLENPDRKKCKSDIYDIRFNFEHKMDSLQFTRFDIPPPSDAIEDEISIDSVNIYFYPTGEANVLLLDSALTLNNRQGLWMKRNLEFGKLYFPPDIDSINVAFEIKLISKDGKEKAKKDYSFNMIKYVDKFRSIPPGWFR